MFATSLDFISEIRLPRLETAWSWDDWALGYCSEFAELGFTLLVLGPLHVQCEWNV